MNDAKAAVKDRLGSKMGTFPGRDLDSTLQLCEVEGGFDV